VVPGGLHALLDNVAVLGAAVGEPAAEGEDRDLQTAGAEVAELLEGLSEMCLGGIERGWKYHVLGVEGALDCGSRHDCGVVKGFAVDVVVVSESCECRQSSSFRESERT
jgi:hypothetical protein